MLIKIINNMATYYIKIENKKDCIDVKVNGQITDENSLKLVEEIKNDSPSTFNVSIDNLVRVDKQKILTDEDESQLNIKITNALLDAISSIKTQSRNGD